MDTLRPAPEPKAVFDTPSEAPAGERSVGASAIDRVLSSLEDSKAEDVVAIDLIGKSALADNMVIASGRSHRHVSAVADHLLRDLKEAGFGSAKVEGLQNGDWVLIDTGDIIVHIFRPEVRSFYNIEKMWSLGDKSDATVH
ncbi:ribosome silencing factor [Aureimonas populi]|uniref:Ribosomal silencing factor RsfS n=1 Tax=Aureimonas populi TaxID=1701758 RepID=A0ABW5CPA1_9HYPH|nr:ribosome silencing factor [Aureimonas populi]